MNGFANHWIPTEVPMAKDDEFQMQLTAEILEQVAQKFLENLIGYYLIMERIFFYSGFVMTGIW